MTGQAQGFKAATLAGAEQLLGFRQASLAVQSRAAGWQSSWSFTLPYQAAE